jgi:hypothetical protein
VIGWTCCDCDAQCRTDDPDAADRVAQIREAHEALADHETRTVSQTPTQNT